MRKPVAPKTILNIQVVLLYGVLALLFFLSYQQLPEIAEFFREYSGKMKAAIPIR
ncbi:MAG: hypothetical protein NXI25_14460 [bacterium]|nr:hypothetical protein [bacterium]